MKKQILLIILFLPLPFCGQSIRITLCDGVKIAQERNPRIMQHLKKIEQRRNDELSSYGNFLPSLSFDFRYTHINDDLVIDLNPIRDVMIGMQSSNVAELTNISNILGGKGALSAEQKLAVKNSALQQLNNLVPEFTETFKKQDYKTGTFTLTQPLFLGGKLLAARKIASIEKESMELELRKIKNEITHEVVSNYLKVLLSKEIVKTRKDVLAGMMMHRDNAKRYFEEGFIANHNYLRAEVAVSEAEKNLINDSNLLRLAEAALLNSLGLDSETDLSLADSLEFKIFSDSLSNLFQSAQQFQPVLEIIRKKKLAAEQFYNIARSALLPEISAFGKYEIYPEYLSNLEPRWAAGISVRYNLFNGFKDYLKLESAGLLENEVEYAYRDSEMKIRLLIEKNYLEVANSKARYEKLASTFELAKENLMLNEKRFDTGLGTSLEVIDARLSLEKVMLDRSITLFQYYSSLNDLFLVEGKPENILKLWNRENK